MDQVVVKDEGGFWNILCQKRDDNRDGYKVGLYSGLASQALDGHEFKSFLSYLLTEQLWASNSTLLSFTICKMRLTTVLY